MSNFKSGSGDLDFSDNDEDPDDTDDDPVSTSGGQATTEARTDQTANETVEESSNDSTNRSSASQYPYFVRRSNVGDERDTRLEIHVRDRVANQESEFRNELAELLDVTEVSKTDAREFALLAAFHHPERVAELMEEEGFGAFG